MHQIPPFQDSVASRVPRTLASLSLVKLETIWHSGQLELGMWRVEFYQIECVHDGEVLVSHCLTSNCNLK